ncbi:hypothetical protein [Streptomyces cyanogenus]|nr:hypothetical protein [Streptomyces cyanogenus]
MSSRSAGTAEPPGTARCPAAGPHADLRRPRPRSHGATSSVPLVARTSP